MRPLAYIITCLAILCSALSADARRTSQGVRNQRNEAHRQVQQTDEQIRQNQQKISNSLHDLDLLGVEIRRCNERIDALNSRIDSINTASAVIADSIARLDAHLESLQLSFSRALRDSRRSRMSMSNTAFIFASESFTQAFRRVRTLQQFAHWRSRKASEIESVKTDLDQRRQQLTSLEHQLREAVSEVGAQRSTLLQKQQLNNSIVASLRDKVRDLRTVLRRQQQRAAELDAELDRIIAEEQRRAEEERRRQEAERQRQEAERRRQEEERRRLEAQQQQQSQPTQPTPTTPSQPSTSASDMAANSSSNSSTRTASPSATSSATSSAASTRLSSSFADNKGRLPYPVDQPFTIVKPFGRQKHPSLPFVETDNSGIDIQTSTGAPVRAVFDGTVSAIFCPDGYNNVVVVRHGNYVTVYANLGTLDVRKGDSVSRNQRLGTVFVDTADGNRSVLHFEIRHATDASNVTKENPQSWLR